MYCQRLYLFDALQASLLTRIVAYTLDWDGNNLALMHCDFDATENAICEQAPGFRARKIREGHFPSSLHC